MLYTKCFYIACLILNILIAKAGRVAQNESHRKNLGSELIKNITEVNKTLKDLIKNYKYLENIYKTDEKVQTDSSGSEIDQKFKQMKRKRKEKKKTHKKTLSPVSLSTLYQGTAYIFDSRTSDELRSKEVKEEKEGLVSDQNKDSKIEEFSLEDKKINSKSSKEEEEISGDIEEIQIDIPKTTQKNKPNKIKPQKVNNVFGKKTRFNVLHGVHGEMAKKRNKSKTRLRVGNQRIVYAEQFSPQTFWNDIVNKPIKLNRVMSSELMASFKDEDKVNVVTLTGNMKKEDQQKSNNNLSNNATKDGSILRNYGDACLVMPIKKCEKALKNVNKNVCKMRFKCKSEFKSDFIENSKKGCQKQYTYNIEESSEEEKTTTIKSTTGNDGDLDVDEEDTYRRRNEGGKLNDGAKYKHLNTANKKQPISTLNGNTNSSVQHSSLRDKYEKQCQKELRAKCIGAGEYAVKKTCSKHECDKKKEKALKKACKQECKSSFVIDKKTSDSSDDGSDNDNDSDSDSDSD
ncbi:uncharacterized protein LOC116775758 [Danaus plexippus]|uniref:uncharacterized protein LOC116775758 n=1 Tax=Danaus plexippus TaxID=13037 RepID=UPI002AB08C2E|nr:uncharacterized protein LOC116775758 [Danaus plexippus]